MDLMIQKPAVERIHCQNKSNNYELLIFGKCLFIRVGSGGGRESRDNYRISKNVDVLQSDEMSNGSSTLY